MILTQVQTRLHSRPSHAMFEEERQTHDSWVFWAETEESFFMTK